MADPVVTQTQSKFPRNELAALARDNPRLVKALEALFLDVGKTLPEAIVDQAQDSSSVLLQRAFIPHAMSAPAAIDDAAAIIATQIFGA